MHILKTHILHFETLIHLQVQVHNTCADLYYPCLAPQTSVTPLYKHTNNQPSTSTDTLLHV